MNGLVTDEAFIPNFDPEGIEEDDRIDRLERPGLPSGNLVQNGVGDSRDQVGRDVDAVKIMEMTDDLPVAHAPGVHRDRSPGKQSRACFRSQAHSRRNLESGADIWHEL